MSEKLNIELFWLVMTVLMTALFWVPYIVNRMKEQGVGAALWDPQGHTRAQARWAERMMRAHENAVENLIIFAPLVLALQVLDISTSVTAGACAAYFFARAVHFVVFTFAVPLLRVVAFLVGFFCQMVLVLTLLGVI
jgi:uncharacterized MAPEG superfamily protein